MLHLLSYRRGLWRAVPLGSYVTRFLCSIRTALLNASCATFKKTFFVLNRMLGCDLLTYHFVIVFWQMTKPQSFSVLLQLPSRQLESVFEVSTKCDLSEISSIRCSGFCVGCLLTILYHELVLPYRGVYCVYLVY